MAMLPASFYWFCGFGFALWFLFFIFLDAWKHSEKDRKKARLVWQEEHIKAKGHFLSEGYYPPYNPWPQVRYQSELESCTVFGWATVLTLIGSLFCTGGALYKGVMVYMSL